MFVRLIFPWIPLAYQCLRNMPPRGWYWRRECPAKMTMSGDSCGVEALPSKLSSAIGFISLHIRSQRYGLKSAPDSVREFGDLE
jgi:hypothetical protein